MAPILYGVPPSPPVRAVLLTAKALGLEMEFKMVDLQKGEHLQPEFIKMNPQHTVPTLDDDGFYIWDSHAIVAYLVGKYGEDDSLYPQDLQKRALVDQRLHFNGSVMFTAIKSIFYPVVFLGEKTVSQDKWDNVQKAYDFLNVFLEDKDWMAGDEMTVADLCLLASVSSVDLLQPVEEESFPRLFEWLNKCKELPYYDEANGNGVRMMESVWKTHYEG